MNKWKNKIWFYKNLIFIIGKLKDFKTYIKFYKQEEKNRYKKVFYIIKMLD